MAGIRSLSLPFYSANLLGPQSAALVQTPTPYSQKSSWEPRSDPGPRVTPGVTLHPVPRWNCAGLPSLAKLPTSLRGSPRTARRNTPIFPRCAPRGASAPTRSRPGRSLTHLLQRPQPGPLGAGVLGCGRGRVPYGRCDLGRDQGLLGLPPADPPTTAQHGRGAGALAGPGVCARGAERRNLAAPGGVWRRRCREEGEREGRGSRKEGPRARGRGRGQRGGGARRRQGGRRPSAGSGALVPK